MRLVLDTNVIAAAVRSRTGASRQLLMAALDRRFEMLASVPLILEYEAVLMRSEHLAASGLNAGEVSELLDAVSAVIKPVALRFTWRPCTKDPADDMVLETAVNGQAECIATFNIRDLADSASEFNIRVAQPSEVWRKIERGGK